MAAEIDADSTRRSGCGGPLSGLVVVDLSTTLPGAMTTQFLAAARADVVFVEPPAEAPAPDALLAGADVVVTTVSRSGAEKLD